MCCINTSFAGSDLALSLPRRRGTAVLSSLPIHGLNVWCGTVPEFLQGHSPAHTLDAYVWVQSASVQ